MVLKLKFFLILGLIILVIAGYGYFKATPGLKNLKEAQPKIEIKPESFDFGEIQYGKILEYTFKVKNTGSKTLEIKRVATSCSCTTAKVTPESITAREEAELLVSYDTGAMTGSHAQGRQERIIYVQSNDPINPQVEVMIYAQVK